MRFKEFLKEETQNESDFEVQDKVIFRNMLYYIESFKLDNQGNKLGAFLVSWGGDTGAYAKLSEITFLGRKGQKNVNFNLKESLEIGNKVKFDNKD